MRVLIHFVLVSSCQTRNRSQVLVIMRFNTLFLIISSPLALALVLRYDQPTKVLAARQAVVTPPPCVAIVPAPTEAETEKRHQLFANAFLVTKNLTNAFEYISSTYIVLNPVNTFPSIPFN